MHKTKMRAIARGQQYDPEWAMNWEDLRTRREKRNDHLAACTKHHRESAHRDGERMRKLCKGKRILPDLTCKVRPAPIKRTKSGLTIEQLFTLGGTLK